MRKALAPLSLTVALAAAPVLATVPAAEAASGAASGAATGPVAGGAGPAAKMGLQGFTRTLALELGPFGVNVNAIAPGFIVTEMTDATARRVGVEPEEYRKAAAERTPVRRVGYPADIAAAAAYLCSDEASFVTGQTLYVDGGAKV